MAGDAGPWPGWPYCSLAALVVLVVLAGAYQPIQFGGASGVSFPGLPTAAGLRSVNTFGLQWGQFYVPPQLGAFTVVESVENTGPETVTSRPSRSSARRISRPCMLRGSVHPQRPGRWSRPGRRGP